jgi:hypothetical protein
MDPQHALRAHDDGFLGRLHEPGHIQARYLAIRLPKQHRRLVTMIYTIAAATRTPQEVVDSLFYSKKTGIEAEIPAHKRSLPQNKHIWATLAGKDAALERLAQQVASRATPMADHIAHKIALCDGCEALQTRITERFPDFSLILDFIHANEYLWKVANSLLGETNPQRTDWVAQRTLQMLSGDTQHLVDEFRQLAQDSEQTTTTQRQQLNKAANYFQRNLPYMHYATYLANGWPIASGVIEGACRHFVKDRLELSGTPSSPDGTGCAGPWTAPKTCSACGPCLRMAIPMQPSAERTVSVCARHCIGRPTMTSANSNAIFVYMGQL